MLNNALVGIGGAHKPRSKKKATNYAREANDDLHYKQNLPKPNFHRT